jgi:hypothetical protein
MSFQDLLIHGRDKIVNRLTGVDTSTILNPPNPERVTSVSAFELSTKIKLALNAFRALAMDPDGNRVDYALLRTSEEYRTYCDCVSQLHYLDLGTLGSRPERLAFWINLYNALTVDAVLQFGVADSVTEGHLGILSFFDRAAYQIGGQRFSLSDIEHGILRANRGFPYFYGSQFSSKDPRRAWVIRDMDPRIHLALNCASRSCPPIGVYSPERLDGQLELASKNFVNSDVSVDRRNGVVSLSSIFRWYRADFGGQAGVINFLIEHLPTNEPNDRRRSWLSDHKTGMQFDYHPYDWSLNRLLDPEVR